MQYNNRFFSISTPLGLKIFQLQPESGGTRCLACWHTDVMRSEGWASGRHGCTWGSEEHKSVCLAARRRRCMGRAVAVVMLAATCAPAVVLGGDLIDDLPNELIEGAVCGTHCANAS